MCDQDLPVIPFPSGWAEDVKSAVLHVTSQTSYNLYCGTFISSPPFSADRWATTPGTVMFSDQATSTRGRRFRSRAVMNSSVRYPCEPPAVEQPATRECERRR